MNPTPDPAPTDLLTAAVGAAALAVTITALDPGRVAIDDPGRPDGLALLLAFRVTGALEGTVTLAADDELVERLEYAAGVSSPVEALAPVADAVVAALAAAGAIDATPLAEVEAGDWPGDAPVIATAVLTGTPDPDDDTDTGTDAGDSDGDRPVLALAFALTVTPTASPAPTAEAGDEVVSGPGQSSMSTSTGPAAIRQPAGTLSPPAPLSPEARRLGAVEVEVAAVLGETSVILHDLLGWLPGVIVSLHRDVGMPLDMRIDDATVAHAEIVVVDERYALRVLDVVAGAQARVAHRRANSAGPGPSGSPAPESSS